MESAVHTVMHRGAMLFHQTDWSAVTPTRHSGETGEALWRTIQYPAMRIRLVEYSANYKADHWCRKGHIVFCIEGEMTSELSDGRTFSLSAGMSYQVSDDMSAHRSSSENGVKLLIIDGNFLGAPRESNPWRM